MELNGTNQVPVRILVVEDEGIVAKDLCRRLERGGYVVCGQADNAAEAIALATTGRPDLVLMDIILQGPEDGIQAAHAIRQQLDLPVVFLTAHSDSASVSRAQQSLPYGYLLKPFEPRELFATIETALFRHRAEARDRLFRQALSSAGVGIAISDLQQPGTPVIWANAAFAEISGHPQEQLLGTDCPCLRLPARNRLAEALGQFDDSGSYHIRRPFLRPDGREFGSDLSISPVRDVAGTVTHHIAVLRDVTPQLQSEQRIRDSEARFRHLLAHTPTVLYTCEANGDFRATYVSDNVHTLCGHPPEHFLASTAFWASHIHPDDRQSTLGQLQQLFDHGQLTLEYRFQCGDGNYLWLRDALVLVRDANGQPDHIIGAWTDVSQAKLNERQLQERLTDGQQALMLASQQLQAETRERLQAEAFAEQLVDTAHAIILVLTPEGRIALANRHLQTLSGFGADELLGLSWVAGFVPETDQATASALCDCLQPELNSAVHTIRTRDGGLRSIEWHTQVLHTPDGIQGLLATGVDITERLEAEQRLSQSEQRFRDAQRHANIGTWDWNIRTGELHWSERIAPLFGYRAGELATTYDNFLAAVHPRDRATVEQAVQAAVQNDAPYELEHRVLWPSGEVRWVLERGGVLRDADGKPSNMLGIVQDITERKLALNAQRQLTAILDASPDMIATADTQGQVTYINQAGRQMLGLADEQPLSSLRAQDFHPTWALQRVFDEALPHAASHGSWVGETALRHRDGFEFPVRQVMLCHRDEHGEIQYYSTMIEDLSRQKQVEEELREARDVAEQANRAKSEFLSSMSHELRTPLNGILGFAQLLQQSPFATLDEFQGEAVQQILNSGWHLLTLINDVLDLARIESGSIAFDIAPRSMRELVSEALHITSYQAGQRQIEIHAEPLTQAEDVVLGDGRRLVQVLTNLIGNAIKYNRTGGWIRLHSETLDGFLRCTVQDSGPGLSLEQQGMLFQPFCRLGAEQGEVEGTGIGLVICKRLIEGMGGRIGVFCAPGEGCSFWIDIPLLTEYNLHPQCETRPQPEPPARGSPLRGQRILYIEDTEANRMLVECAFQKLFDLSIDTATSGEQGLAMIAQSPPDLLLLDINLPDISGLEIARQLKANPATAHIPLVGLSANAMPGDLALASEAGFDAYLTKPLSLEQLASTIKQIISDQEGTPDHA